VGVGETCRRHPFLHIILNSGVLCDTLRQQDRRRLHPLHVSLNILSHINNLDDAIAFLFPSTVLADPVVCLKRALTLNNSYVDEFDILPTDSDEGQLDYVHTLSYHKLDMHNIIQLCYMYYSADI
jgi:hypothetical protein